MILTNRHKLKILLKAPFCSFKTLVFWKTRKQEFWDKKLMWFQNKFSNAMLGVPTSKCAKFIFFREKSTQKNPPKWKSLSELEEEGVLYTLVHGVFSVNVVLVVADGDALGSTLKFETAFSDFIGSVTSSDAVFILKTRKKNARFLLFKCFWLLWGGTMWWVPECEVWGGRSWTGEGAGGCTTTGRGGGRWGGEADEEMRRR